MHPRHSPHPSHSKASKLEKELLLEADEKVLLVVAKHPFGIAIIYFWTLVALLLVGVVAWLALSGGDVSIDNLSTVATLSMAGAIILIATILLIATYIYLENRFVITDKHIVQILQQAVFYRKVSQLSLLNVEDVTVEKKGIFATIFNFGTLTIETAGEQRNFVYSYCPNPHYYADAILDARHNLINTQKINTTDPASPAN